VTKSFRQHERNSEASDITVDSTSTKNLGFGCVELGALNLQVIEFGSKGG